jgi:hypothetical protein
MHPHEMLFSFLGKDILKQEFNAHLVIPIETKAKIHYRGILFTII